MKNTIIQSVKVIMLGLILSAGIALAQVWTPPAGGPPGNNAPAPINVSSVNQVKDGGLATGPLAVFGDSAMYGDVSLLGYGLMHRSSNLFVSGTVTIDTLAHEQVGSAVCVDGSGQLIICNQTQTPPSLPPPVNPSQPHGTAVFPGTASPWQVPADVTSITVQAWGGGGGGGQGGSSGALASNVGGSAGGGGGGGSDVRTITVTPLEFLNVNIGSGGTGGTGNQDAGDDGHNGNPGVASKVLRGTTQLIFGNPGLGGVGGLGANRGGADNAGGAGGGGLDNGSSGASGSPGYTSNGNGAGGDGGQGAGTTGGVGGNGGIRPAGGQGYSGNLSVAPGVPGGGGGGGGGGMGIGGGHRSGGTGGNGAAGKVIITW